jgi:hypothetical protein
MLWSFRGPSVKYGLTGTQGLMSIEKKRLIVSGFGKQQSQKYHVIPTGWAVTLHTAADTQHTHTHTYTQWKFKRWRRTSSAV